MGNQYWLKLVAEHGLEGAREIQRGYTRRRKTSGFAAMTKTQRTIIAMKSVESRRKKREANKTTETENSVKS